MPSPGGLDPYPHAGRGAASLTSYAAHLGGDIRTSHRVTRRGDAGYEAELADGCVPGARAMVAASGTFGASTAPTLPVRTA
ncbi:hypothetical protein [Streptomyces sp. NPDC053431]|uniref:hypothetical protein n=1 Tax=Streptomyces sp. NPDC053431 TaxID=3365703 RepID=UPI0037CCD6DC